LGQATTALGNRVIFYGTNATYTGGTLSYIGAGASTTDRSIGLNGANNVIAANGAGPAATLTITGSAGGMTSSGGVAAPGGPLVLSGTNTGWNAFQGAITAGTLAKTGPGFWAISGINTYEGGTTISQGTLAVAGPASLPGYSTPGQLSISDGATMVLQTGPSGWNDLSIYSMFVGNYGGLGSAWTLGIDTTNGDLLSDTSYPAAAVGLVKLGTGTLTLGGSNGYTGGTTVADGTLIVTNSDAIYSGTNLYVGDPTQLALLPAPVALSPVVTAAAVTPVPEPGTLMLLTAGLLVGALSVRRRRKGSRD
jgi:fibronectin-binding autotransporter adhesin